MWKAILVLKNLFSGLFNKLPNLPNIKVVRVKSPSIKKVEKITQSKVGRDAIIIKK